MEARRVYGWAKKLAFGLAVMFGLSAGVAWAVEAKTPQEPKSFKSNEQERFVRQQLINAILIYDRHLRNAESGQYLDRLDLTQKKQTSDVSSIASTGPGLISLILGDRLGVVDQAAEKAVVTLENLLNTDPRAAFLTPRSRSGWFKHFIHVRTGEARNASSKVFSTIDTAILGAGAFMVARYFADKPPSDEAAYRASKLAYRLVDSINWSQAVRFGQAPGVHQVFKGRWEAVENRFYSRLFDEYVLLPCIGRAMEARRGYRGRATEFWDAYVRDVNSLPQAKIDDSSVLAVVGRTVPSHFTHQFAYYFCGDLGGNPSFQAELRELKAADKGWFSKAGKGKFPTHWWGLGAGSEIKFDQTTGAIKYSGYGVARLGKNPNGTFSPAIMAGFLGAEQSRYLVAGDEDFRVRRVRRAGLKHSPIVADLMTLHARKECRYSYQGLDFLWRCSTRDASLRVKALEGVDFSTYMLGLASFDPAIGANFFSDYAVKARPTFPATRELRASLKSLPLIRSR